MKLTMLGTGNAMTTKCYNTCFLLEEDGEFFLTDGGGGNGILRQLEQAGADVGNIRYIFLTHKHMDHILGVLWVIRVMCQRMAQGKPVEDVWIYSHEEGIDLLRTMAASLLQPKQSRFLGEKIHLVTVVDGESKTILGRNVTFFDIDSHKAKQFGFSMTLKNGRKLICCGDEPCSESGKAYARNSQWMLHEAFCLMAQANRFKPYEKHHSTAADAAFLADGLGVENLVLYHTEDENLADRRRLYTQEAQVAYSGKIWVPEDLERIEIE